MKNINQAKSSTAKTALICIAIIMTSPIALSKGGDLVNFCVRSIHSPEMDECCECTDAFRQWDETNIDRPKEGNAPNCRAKCTEAKNKSNKEQQKLITARRKASLECVRINTGSDYKAKNIRDLVQHETPDDLTRMEIRECVQDKLEQNPH